MMRIVLDANAVIMHGRAFPDRVRARTEQGDRIILPEAVKRELVDDVLENDDAPDNHRQSAQTIEGLIEEGSLSIRSPDFERYSGIIDESRRRIADESLPEHAVRADQYIPALVCELAEEGPICLVTADKKLRHIVRDVTARQTLDEEVTIASTASAIRFARSAGSVSSLIDPLPSVLFEAGHGSSNSFACILDRRVGVSGLVCEVLFAFLGASDEDAILEDNSCKPIVGRVNINEIDSDV